MEDILPVYLPIANLSVNGFLIVLLGAVTGVLSGLFGVGGGFLTTPLLIFYGILWDHSPCPLYWARPSAPLCKK